MKKRIKLQMKKIVAILLIATMMLGVGSPYGLFTGKTETNDVQAAQTTITSMDYYDAANGASQTKSAVDEVSFGVVLPKFNGKNADELCIDDVSGDLEVFVKQDAGTNGQWKDIDSVSSFVWNSNWAWEKQQWAPGVYGWILWMKVNETTQIKFHGKANDVNLEYTFNVNKLPKISLTSIATTENNIMADTTGGSATHWGAWTFNGDKSIKYEQVEDDITILVNNNDGKGFVKFLSNAESGFLWDQNFGYYTEGDGGYWFKNINWSFTLRFQKKTDSKIYQDVNVTYNEPVRNNYALSAYEGISYDASTKADAAVGIPLPKIGGTAATKKDLDLFKYEVKVNDEWISLADTGASGWVYEGNGYNSNSLSQQWGYFSDNVFGLWFQPVKKDTQIRISYPIDGKKGGDMSNNYVVYTIKGNTSYQPTLPSDMSDIQVEDSSNAFTPSGWKMIWNDEFLGNVLDTSKWGYEEGFLLDENDINTAGWGNQELEWYTRNNVSVKDGALNINMKKESKEFSQKNDPSKKATALYSSGKITTKDKFSVKYGRVDFRAKMPTGVGVWPAMWMLSNDARYGSWPLSGEIDVFEGRGRTPDMVFGTLHYGAQWPNNINTSDVLNMKQDGNKKSGIDDWHVYSVVWEAENIKIYCDGKCYFKCTNADWYSGSDRGNAYAPFDQRFYLILNLAAGGTFDSGYVPDSSFKSGTMQVDYVRVYQKKVSATEDEKPDKNQGTITDGTNDNLYGDYKLGSGSTPPNPPESTTKPSVNPTEPETVVTPVTTKENAQRKVKVQKVKIKKATKKKSAKKAKITLKKLKGVKRYQIKISKSKSFKKKNIIVTRTVKKVKFVIRNKKLKNRKKLYVKARAIKVVNGTTYYGKWSKKKKIRIQK